MPHDALCLDLGSITFSGVSADDPNYTDVQVQTTAGAQKGEVHFPYGLWGVPPDPVRDPQGKIDASQACPALYAWEGDYLHIWPLEDPRRVAEFPNWKKGEAGLYGPAQNVVRMADDGSIAQATTDDGTAAGDAIFQRLGPNGWIMQAPWGRMTFGPEGFHVLCASGARIDLGAIHGLPAPLDALSTYATIQAQMIALESSVTSLGPDNGKSASAALAPPLLAYLTGLSQAVADLSLAVATLAKIPAVNGAAPYATGALAALIEKAADEASAATTVPLTIAATTSLT